MRRIAKTLLALAYLLSPLLTQALPFSATADALLCLGPSSALLGIAFAYGAEPMWGYASLAWAALLLLGLIVGIILVACGKHRLFLALVAVDTIAPLLLTIGLALSGTDWPVLQMYLLGAAVHIITFLVLRHWFRVLDTYP